jgi:hypothetical protein
MPTLWCGLRFFRRLWNGIDIWIHALYFYKITSGSADFGAIFDREKEGLNQIDYKSMIQATSAASCRIGAPG